MAKIGEKDVGATVAVRNLGTAKEFYGRTLGLEIVENMEPGGIVYRSGRSRLLVYVSEHAGTNRATAATWDVGDSIDDIVRALKTQGVRFEHYDLPDTTRDGDVHVSGNLRLAWLKDPDGNILALAGTA
jgi:catechol 2,3-dioxygenase-like lactoylglutathione lyase family enzyme